MTSSSSEPSTHSSAAPTADPAYREQVTVLEQALWRRLDASAGLEEFSQAWLDLQCRMIEGVRQGVVVLRAADGDAYVPVARWPEDAQGAAGLAAAAEAALSERRGVVRKGGDVGDGGESDPVAALAYPLLVDGAAHGVVGIQVAVRTQVELGTSMRQLQWGAAWMRDRVRKQLAEDKDKVVAQTTLALDVMAMVLEQERFSAACRTAVTELSSRAACQRVSVGFVKRGHSQVATISHSAEFGKHMNLVHMLGSAMDEAIDQRAMLRYPARADDAPLVMRAHEELARAHGAGTVLSVPMFLRDRYFGAFTFERGADQPFDRGSVDLLACVTAMLGPVLEEKRRDDRWLITKAAESLGRQARRLLGPGHLIRKLAAVATIVLVVAGYLAMGEYRVAANARIEGEIQRSMVAPFDGYIREAPVRAGDTVRVGELLAALDDRDLALARLRWVTERAQNQHRFDQALSARERSETKIIRTEIEKADAQIELIDKQLARARVLAPFDGIVVSGDLSQRINASVTRGDLLFEIAPLHAYRVILSVDESQIAEVAVGQHGELLLTSIPSEPFPIVVTSITPVAETQEGRNTFRVEAQLERISAQLRPGMEGVSKIDIGERRLVWIWSRALVNRLRIWAWRWVRA